MSSNQTKNTKDYSLLKQIRQLFDEKIENKKQTLSKKDQFYYQKEDLPNAFVKCDMETLISLFVHPNQNVEGNYENYLKNSLETIDYLRTLDYEKALTEQKASLKKEDKSTILNLSKGGKKLLFLDLDETLIHSDFNKEFNEEGKILKFTAEDTKEEISVKVFLRPCAYNFLKILSDKFDLAVFTSASKDYADAVIDLFDPEKNIFKFRLYRNNCINIENFIFIKDLRILEEFYDLKDVIILDNSIYSFSNQLSNGILINSFFKDPEDAYLVQAANYLWYLSEETGDIREINNKIFQFEENLERISQRKYKN